MASEQIEYCGSCKHFAECLRRASKGRLKKCKANDERSK